MTHGSLFSGIGGFDLAAEWMGWDNLFHCEWNPFGQRVLKYYWPKAVSYEDITKTDFTIWRGRIDVLTGGFPCQPYSLAGKRKGKDDERHLWPEMLRAIREIRPTWIVGENVFGLVNWNGGLVFDEVQADLEAEGYEVQPYVLPACAVNAPHRRDRVWFVAYSIGSMLRTNEHRGLRCEDGENKSQRAQRIYDAFRSNGNSRTATNTNGNGLNECNGEHEINTGEGWQYAQCNIEPMGQYDVADTTSSRCGQTWGQREPGQFNENSKINNWQDFPTQSPICTGDDGLSSRLDTSAISFSKWRNESIKAAGNAVVPQVVFQILKSINNYVTIYG